MPTLSRVSVKIDELGVAYGFLVACAATTIGHLL